MRGRQPEPVELERADPLDDFGLAVRTEPGGGVRGVGGHVPVEQHNVVGDGESGERVDGRLRMTK